MGRVHALAPTIGISKQAGSTQEQGSREMSMYAVDPSFEKLLSDNRDRYIQQSSDTRYGQVARLPKRNQPADWSNRPEMSVWFSESED
jgi:hypothetical protein